MKKIEFGYNNDFSGQANSVKTEDFHAGNIKEYYLLDQDITLFVRNDGTLLFQDLRNGRCYISSNRQYSYSLTVEPGAVVLKF